jgi:hypothetical protein
MSKATAMLSLGPLQNIVTGLTCGESLTQPGGTR